MGMQELPLVTIIIPVYKRLRYLDQAIESALTQSYSRIEVLVVDDGSPLDPGPIVGQFGLKVKLLRKKNGGLASARNLGISMARGKYLSFLDDDDFLEKDAIEVLISALRSKQGSVWAAGKFAYVNEVGARLARNHPCVYGSGDVYQRMLLDNLMGAPSVVLVQADVVRACGCFDETLLLSEDWDLWITLARDFPLVAVDKVVTNYRIHSQQISRQEARHLEYHIRVLEKQRMRARSGTGQMFDAGVAKLHRAYGDMCYLGNGEQSMARRHWKRARQLGGLGYLDLGWRVLKSFLPSQVLSKLRAVASRMRARHLNCNLPTPSES